MKIKKQGVAAVLLVAAFVLAPIATYEVALLLTGSHVAAGQAMRGALDTLWDVVTMWLVIELFVLVKVRRVGQALTVHGDVAK